VAERERLMELERDGQIATIVLNRPEKLNAWSWESARQVASLADEIRFDDDIRVVIMRAEGRAFCAGVDLGMPEDRITGRSPAEKVRNYYEKFRWVHERFNVLANLPQPVLMAVHGYCLGAGFEVAMMGDIRIAADDARFALPEPKVGVSIDAGGDIRCRSTRGDERPWRIAVEDPAKKRDYPEVFGLTTSAVATSGNYESFFDEEKSFHHIVDPGSGVSPIENASTSVIASSTMLADALSTATMVLPGDRGLELINSIQGVDCLLIGSDGNQRRSNNLDLAIRKVV